MKKFLAVFDGFKMSHSTMQYSIQFAKESGAHLVGVFLDDFIYHSYSVYQAITSYENYEAILEAFNQRDAEKRSQAVVLFQGACEAAGVHFSIHRDKDVATQEIQRESLFADLVITSKTETFSNDPETPPTRFIKELLTDVQCPVLLVPSTYRRIDEVVLLYDEKPSSIHAFKMFSYILQDILHLPVEVYTVEEHPRVDAHLTAASPKKEFFDMHFAGAKFQREKGVAAELVPAHLATRPVCKLVVCGADKRSFLSKKIRPGMAEVLMKQLDEPLFIAHNK
jgi:hypothetical protein